MLSSSIWPTYRTWNFLIICSHCGLVKSYRGSQTRSRIGKLTDDGGGRLYFFFFFFINILRTCVSVWLWQLIRGLELMWPRYCFRSASPIFTRAQDYNFPAHRNLRVSEGVENLLR